MSKCIYISTAVLWFVMVVFAVCLWVTVDFSYIDTRFHTHSATCTLLNCTILRATCSHYTCSGSSSSRRCWTDYYTCYKRKVTLEVTITTRQGNVEPGVYVGDDSTTHDDEPSTCVDFENGVTSTKCYYDDRSIASSLTMSSTRFLKGPIIGVSIMSVATFIVFVATVVVTVLCCMEVKDRGCQCYCISDCVDDTRDKFHDKFSKTPTAGSIESPTNTSPANTPSDLWETPGGDSPNL